MVSVIRMMGVLLTALLLGAGAVACGGGSSDSRALTADFEAEVDIDSSGGTVCTPRTISFTDRSSGDPTSWLWTLTQGDVTEIFEEQNPTWSPAAAGTTPVAVRLEVVEAGGTIASTTETITFPVC